MRRGVAANSVAGCAKRRVDHRRERSFAVRASDDDRVKSLLRAIELIAQCPDVLEPELDAETFEAEEVVDRIHDRRS